MLLALFINSCVVAIVVLIHYECLQRLSHIVPHMPFKHRFRVAVALIGAILAHVVEIWVFALVYFLMSNASQFGTLQVVGELNLLDCVYFSFSTYSTLGYGDILPTGDIRYLAGIEALTGLVLITWTASFLYFEMQRYWSNK